MTTRKTTRNAALLTLALLLGLALMPVAEAAMTICWECYESTFSGQQYCDPYPFDHGGTECWVIGGQCATTGECSHHLQITR